MKKSPIFLILILIALFLNGCKYDFILEEQSSTAPPSSGPVSFSTQISPIFSTGNKCTSCHNTGGQAPDLTPAKAYASIVPSLVVLDNPSTSIIYTFPNPANSAVHSWKKYTSSEAALVLQWITEGAKDN